FTCGGSLISSYYVLTAAHCIEYDSTITSVRLGEWNSSKDPDCQDGICAPPYQDIKVVEVIRHEDYNVTDSVYNDIALLRLESPPNISSFVRPVCLPYGAAMTKDFTSEDMLFVGWGNMKEFHFYDETTPTILQGLKQEEYIQQGNFTITEQHICFWCIKGYDICPGDSGGPVIWTGSFEADVSDRNYLLGVVPVVPVCGGCNVIPSVYAKTTFFMKWILDHIRE
ncbi:hypothetical protein WDU94_000141, partial [Cyamophila willieti]